MSSHTTDVSSKVWIWIKYKYPDRISRLFSKCGEPKVSETLDKFTLTFLDSNTREKLSETVSGLHLLVQSQNSDELFMGTFRPSNPISLRDLDIKSADNIAIHQIPAGDIIVVSTSEKAMKRKVNYLKNNLKSSMVSIDLHTYFHLQHFHKDKLAQVRQKNNLRYMSFASDDKTPEPGKLTLIGNGAKDAREEMKSIIMQHNSTLIHQEFDKVVFVSSQDIQSKQFIIYNHGDKLHVTGTKVVRPAKKQSASKEVKKSLSTENCTNSGTPGQAMCTQRKSADDIRFNQSQQNDAQFEQEQAQGITKPTQPIPEEVGHVNGLKNIPKVKYHQHPDSTFTASYSHITAYKPIYEDIYIWKQTDTKVKLWMGDITKINTDAIVNAANSRLDHGGGVAAAISEAAGPKMQETCTAYIKTSRELPVGHVYTTTGFNLPCKHVIHAVGPQWKLCRDEEQCRVLLRDTFKACFLEANKLRLSSLAVPAISSGIYGVPMNVVCGSLYTEIYGFLSWPSRCVKEICICDINDSFLSNMATQLQITDEFTQ